MALSDPFWKHPLTAELYHNTDKASDKFADEVLISDFLKGQDSHVLVDLGIGTGRELDWLRGIQSIESVIGLDYSPHMINLCMEIWHNYSKRLILFPDDFEKLQNLSQVLKEEPKPAVFLSLSNTFGNLPPGRRAKALKKISSVARSGDRFVFALYKRKAGKDNYAAEVEYYKKNYPMFDRVVWDLHGTLAVYEYDEKNHNIVIGSGKEPVYISHRWAKDEVSNLFSSAGLEFEKIIEGAHTYICVGRKR